MDHSQMLNAYTTAEALDPSKRREAQAQAHLPQAPQCDAEPSSSPDNIEHIAHPAAFSFPTLSPDGSIEDISAYSAPSQHQKAEREAMSDTGSMTDSQYDFMEDVSDSSEGQETASLASTERAPSDDGLDTPEDIMSVVEEDFEQHGEATLLSNQLQHVPDRDDDDTLGTLKGHMQKTLDSFLADDLETPRASTMDVHFPNQGASQRPPPGEQVKSWRQKLGQTDFWTNRLVTSFLALLVLCLCIPSILTPRPVMEEQMVRKEALVSALIKLTNSTEATKTFDLDHLVPTPTPAGQSLFGQPVYDMPYTSYYQGAPPNHIIVSLIKTPNKLWFPRPFEVRVSKGTRDLAFNQTKLIEGIYDISIDNSDAYGLVEVSMITRSPSVNFTMQYNFGNRMLQRQTYQKAGTDLSKSMNKDLVVARKAARSFTEKLQLEFAASASATSNITKQIAVYAARDLQILSSNTASFFGRVGRASNNTIATIRKDLIVYHGELVKFGDSMKALVPSKKQTLAPLKRASDRVKSFKHKLAERRARKREDFSRASSSLSTVPGKGLTSQEPQEKKLCKRAIKRRESAQKAADKELKKIALERERDAEQAARRQASLCKKEKRAKVRVAKLADDE
ncbi:hypothetical protein B0A50_07112 [Salinomyces thailandicus]|uniref:Uncharacterized protein n=1 Tax=Salinomyces thailandicus TaxID=706561 RepID=A0A4U0TNH1_9PEZI|nr:hypothetical protein B0A50_07112 [Salinomyces thailandica]